MIRCSPFSRVAPTSIEEVARVLAAEGEGAALVAGGTDVVPQLKRRTMSPRVLVSLSRVRDLRRLARSAGPDAPSVLGAGLTLAEIAEDPRLAPFRALRRAAAQVATPHLRNVATVGGNLCLDTRCNYYDQSWEWRRAIDFCTKRDGSVCWVAPGSERCWAVSSSDLAPALIALGAEVRLVSTEGYRPMPLADLYQDDGIAYLAKRHGEVLTEIALPDPSGWRSTYLKLRRREAFDFPVLGVAVALRVDGEPRDGRVREARIVLGAAGCRPIVCDGAARLLEDAPLSDESIARAADAAARQAKPMDNTDVATPVRKRVARVFVEAALRELRGDDPAALGLLARRAVTLPILP